MQGESLSPVLTYMKCLILISQREQSSWHRTAVSLKVKRKFLEKYVDLIVMTFADDAEFQW